VQCMADAGCARASWSSLRRNGMIRLHDTCVSVVKQAPMSDGLECMEFPTRNVPIENT
jgi:hypothetical protein